MKCQKGEITFLKNTNKFNKAKHILSILILLLSILILFNRRITAQVKSSFARSEQTAAPSDYSLS